MTTGVRANSDVFALSRQLIDIPSVTGNEAAIGDFLVDQLRGLGYEVEKQLVSGNRANVIATTATNSSVFLSTHMDTVPEFIPSSEDTEYIYGRGACDAKGIIAAQICAAERLRATGTAEPGLLFTVDEEMTSSGAKAANQHSAAGACRFLINGEPTDNQLATGSKGSLQATVCTTGRAAHSAYPEQGESAIEKLLDLLADVRELSWPSSELFGETTCNIGVISGGTRSNVIPAEARAVLHLRLGVPAAEVKRLIEMCVDEAARVEYGSTHDPQQMFSVDGFEQTVVRFTTDIPYLTNWGKPLLIGPGSILDAHTDHERVRKSDLLTAVELYCELVRRLML